jgi:hypothetical protein
VLLKYAMLCLVESIKKDPDRFPSLIFNDIDSPASSTWDYLSQYHAAFDKYGQHQEYPSPYNYSDDCIDKLVEEGEKLYNILANKCVDGTIADYAASIRSLLPSLPPPSDEK